MVYVFATLTSRKLSWRYTEAADESVALKQARKIVGSDVDIYAGPFLEKGQAHNCNQPAARLGGHGAWCPLCEQHLAGPFPYRLK